MSSDQRRNVNVFDSDGAIIAGNIRDNLDLPDYLLTRSVDDLCRLLAIWHAPMGRVLQILDPIRCCVHRLVDFPIRTGPTSTWRAVSPSDWDCATRVLYFALHQ